MAKTSKYAKQFDITKVVGALGGGIASGIIVDQLEEKVKFFKSGTGEKIAPYIPAILGSLIIYAMDDKYKAIGYGMLGATGLDVGDTIADKVFQGFSRVNYLEPGNSPYTVSTSPDPIITTDTINGVTLNDEMADEILI